MHQSLFCNAWRLLRTGVGVSRFWGWIELWEWWSKLSSAVRRMSCYIQLLAGMPFYILPRI